MTRPHSPTTAKAGIEAPLDFRKVVAAQTHVLSNRINILLAGDDDPRLAAAAVPKSSVTFAGLASVWSPHRYTGRPRRPENHMMVIALVVDILFYQLCEILNANAVWLRRLLAPVASRCLTHEAHVRQDFHDAVLNKVKAIAEASHGLP
jgi:hypothetical protein